jgi:hypothetical protein
LTPEELDDLPVISGPGWGHDDQWRRHAACTGLGGERWFPDDGPGTEGRRICAGCPVREDCLQAALGDTEQFGTWGGASERVRRMMRARLSRCPHPDRPRRIEGCGCRFCAAWDEHLVRLDALARGEQAPPADTRGPNVRHGTPSCYPKGCRRPECLAALREWRRERRELKRREAEDLARAEAGPSVAEVLYELGRQAREQREDEAS